ncbi:MAG: GGDEF domain-containing protein [Treponema sp.]|nr:GGDEF domain-containing protein [Treponema sp.]
MATAFVQHSNYKKLCIDRINYVGDYLANLIQLQDKEFIAYQDYYLKHYSEIEIPYAFTEYNSAKKEYEALLIKDLEAQNISFDSFNWSLDLLSEETQKAWFIYTHEYWLLTFEKAREAFDLPYTYYLVPRDDAYNMVYVIDGERSEKLVDGKKCLYLGDEYFNDPKVYDVEWRAWFTGKKQSDIQIWENEWGHTYAFYTPLVLQGKKLGLIGTEVSASFVNNNMVSNVFNQLLVFSIILIVGLVIILFIINKLYVSKIVKLEANVRKYSITKNYKIAEKIEAEAKGHNEISSLAKRISEMIIEIENYMRNVFSVQGSENEEASDYGRVRENDFLRRDALTGIRAGASFEKELNRLETERKNGQIEFGFAYVDLNDLGLINSHYGIEQGNAAVKKLCSIVCSVFSHSPVFRVGGDDFVAILYNEDYNNAKALVTEFNEKLIQVDEAIEPWEDISAAVGIALYDQNMDGNAESLLNRSELNMQNCKKMMKARRKV